VLGDGRFAQRLQAFTCGRGFARLQFRNHVPLGCSRSTALNSRSASSCVASGKIGRPQASMRSWSSCSKTAPCGASASNRRTAIPALSRDGLSWAPLRAHPISLRHA
jgi:hypothetical protein